MYNYTPKKSLGQNFLKDKSVIRRILSLIPTENIDTIVEIGPGKGALTRSFITIYPKIIIIEKDQLLSAFWEQEKVNKKIERLTIFDSDFLELDPDKLSTHTNNSNFCFSSLPYNVSKKILFSLLYQHAWFTRGIFIIQKEVAQDYCSQPPNSNFLSRVIQLVGKCEYMFDIPPEAFTPKPKVVSAVIKIEKTTPLIKTTDKQIEFLKFVKNLYGYKRKTIRNSIKMAYKKEKQNPEEFLLNIEKMKLSDKRVEELTPEQLIKIWE